MRKAPISHERVGRVLAGLSLMGALALALTVSPWFLLAVAGMALNLALSGITDRCAVKSLLVRLGVPGERDIGRAEAFEREESEAFPMSSVPASREIAPGAGRRFCAGQLSSLRN